MTQVMLVTLFIFLLAGKIKSIYAGYVLSRSIK